MIETRRGYELETLDSLVGTSYTAETIPQMFDKPKEILEGYEVAIDHRHVLGYIADFLRGRAYAIGDFVLTRGSRFPDKIDGHFEIGSNVGKKRVKVEVARHLLDGYSATLEDEGIPFLCPADIKYEFKFSKKGRLVKAGDNLFTFDLTSIFLSHSQRDKTLSKESWFHRFVYGTRKKELRKLYEAMPEMRYAVNRSVIDLIAETVLRFTTIARVIQDAGENAWYLWLSSGATAFTIAGERYYSEKAAGITSVLPQAIYSGMIESPQNTINRIVERRDVASWHRFQEVMDDLASDAGLSETEVLGRVSKLEAILRQDNGREKVRQEVIRWRLGSNGHLDKVTDELSLIDYASISSQLSVCVSELDDCELLKNNTPTNGLIERLIQGFPGRNPAGLRKHLSDELRGVVREPSQAEHGRMLSEVRAALSNNIKGDFGIFMGHYPLAYLASSNLQIPIAGFITYYLVLEAMEFINASGFARLNNVINLNYILKELDKDPAISSGADVNNQLNSHLAVVGAVVSPLSMLVAATGQYFSPRTGGITNYVMDAAALAAKYIGMKQWYKFMDSLIDRCQLDLIDDEVSESEFS